LEAFARSRAGLDQKSPKSRICHIPFVNEPGKVGGNSGDDDLLTACCKLAARSVGTPWQARRDHEDTKIAKDHEEEMGCFVFRPYNST
jgi:hypothetical protein